MNKPELKDFGLNENSLKLYQKQKEEYEKNQYLLKPECVKYYNKRTQDKYYRAIE